MLRRGSLLPFLLLVTSISGDRPGLTAEHDPKLALTGLPDHWKLTKSLPVIGATRDKRPGSLTLYVERGWVIARRETGAGQEEWCVVLAQATDPQPPVVTIRDETGALSIRYRTYLIREIVGHLRILRERKNDQSPVWSLPPRDPKEVVVAEAGEATVLAVSRDWYWGHSGPSAKTPDVRVRLQHVELGDGYSVQGYADGLRYVACGNALFQDEGDFLFATRTTTPDAEARVQILRKRKEISDKEAPALDSGKWFNVAEAVSLEKLKGKVVLLDFWGQWCAPCVKMLPQTEELHKMFKDRGLVVIGVHSTEKSDNLEDFIKSKHLSFPVIIDRGDTARRYLVDTWPTYFLIDKSARIVWGFGHEPPDALQIEKLLRR